MTASFAQPVDVWTLNASGLASVDANWSLGAPLAGGNVLVAPPTPITITFDRANFTLATATLKGATLSLRDGSLAVSAGMTLQNATVLGPHALTVGGAGQVSGLTLGGGTILYNKGVMTQSAGAVVIGTSKTSTALIFNMVGANWIDADNSGLTAGAFGSGLIYNYGQFTDSAGGGVTLVSVSILSTGAISVAARGTLEFNGPHATLSGTLIGGGLVDYGAADLATLGALAVTATNQTNFGTVNLVGDMTFSGAQTVINNHIWNFDGDVSLLGGAGVQFTSVPNALVAKTAGTGVSVVSVSAGVYGALEIDTGALDFTGASGIFSLVYGAGTLEIGGGTAQIGPYGAPSQTISVAHLRLAAGTTTFAGAVTDTGAFEGDSAATLTANGVLTLSGAADFAGLAMNGSGQIVIGGAAQVSGASIGGTTTLLDRGTVTQAGGAVTLDGGAQLTLDHGGVWNIADASSILSGLTASALVIGGAGTSGLLEKTGAGVSLVAPPAMLNNASNVVTGSGVQYEGVEAAGGTLVLHSAVSGTGTDNIVGAATLEFDNAVSAGQTVTFAGSGGSLFVNDAPGFQGAIVGFSASDALLVGVNGQFFGQFTGAIESASATVLSFAAGPSTFSLTLTGDYRGDTFSAQAQTIGGPLKITY